MRLIAIILVFVFFSFYSWKDWYKGACALIVLMALMQLPYMPRGMLGIPGLNLWNILMLSVLFSFMASKKKEGLRWDLTAGLTFLLLVYFSLVYISTYRLMGNMGPLNQFYQFFGTEPPTKKDLIIENFVNTFRYLVPGFLIFVGCNSRERFNLAILSMLALHILLAIQVIRWMPISNIVDSEVLNQRGIRVLGSRIGYFRTDLAMMLAGATWMFVVASLYFKQWRTLLLIGAAICLLAMALTGGRGGYVSWAAIGFVFAFFRWRKLVLLAPVVVALVFTFVPAVKDRLFQGVGGEANEVQLARLEAVNIEAGDNDLYSISSGRLVVWPVVVEHIKKAPYWGYGRRGFLTSGAGLYVADDLNDLTFGHPHNAYLQFIIDNGLIGAVPVFFLFMLIAKRAISLVRDRSNIIFVAAGGVGGSAILSFLVAGMSAQYFYPIESSVPMWVGIALVLRVYLERQCETSWVHEPIEPIPDFVAQQQYV